MNYLEIEINSKIGKFFAKRIRGCQPPLNRGLVDTYMILYEISCFTRIFQNLQALATRLLQTIGSKRVANTQTMETNGSIVAIAFVFKI